MTLLSPDEKGTSQTGISDSNILCAACDNTLGIYDKHAVEISRLLGTSSEKIGIKSFEIHNKKVNHEYLALFAASVVWRASVSKRLPEFSLGKNEVWFQDMIFRKDGEIPTVMIARAVGKTPEMHEATPGAIMYPCSVRSADHLNFARFYARGLDFIVQTSRRKHQLWSEFAITTFGASLGEGVLTGIVIKFEEMVTLESVFSAKYFKEKKLS